VIRDYVCPEEILGLPAEPGPLRFAEPNCIPWRAQEYETGLPFAVLHIHTRWERKSWPMDRWEALIPELLEFVPRLLISCGPEAREVESAHTLCDLFGPRVQTTAGTANWTQLAWLLPRAAFFVGVDTAAMHLAAACQCPSVVLFGPSPAFEYHPWKTRHWMMRPENWPGEEEAKKFPGEKLMERIPVEKVLAACREAWTRKNENA
jgi:heptosyltransferase-3